MNDVRVIYDRNTATSKGMAYVEFEDVASVPAALATTGQILRNQVVMVKASEAEKNARVGAGEARAPPRVGYAASQDPLAGSIPLPAPLPSADAVGGPCDLLVHNLHAASATPISRLCLSPSARRNSPRWIATRAGRLAGPEGFVTRERRTR